MAKKELPKVLVVGDLNDNQKGILAKLVQLENQGKCQIEYKSEGRPAIVFDPVEIKI